MTEMQIAGLSIILAGALPCFLLANYIEKNKHYSLFSGWDPARISDEDACGKLMCTGIRAFALTMGLGGVFLFLTQRGGDLRVFTVALLPVAPLLYYVFKARKLYWRPKE